MLISDLIQRDTRANQPAASAVPEGTLFYVTDESILERSSGSAWETMAEEGGGAWTTLFKAAAETRASTTTLANDTDLQFALLANKSYVIRMCLFVFINDVPDFKFDLSGPASPSLIRVERRHKLTGSAAPTDVLEVAYTSSTSILVSSAENAIIQFEILVRNGANAGTFAFRWAQVTSDASIVSVLEGSFLEYIQVD